MRIFNLILRIVSILLYPRKSWGNNIFWKVRFRGVKGNYANVRNTLLKKTLFTFKGSGNVIEASGCNIYNCDIFLRGKNHKLVLEEGVQLFNMRIKIIGSGNEVHIGKGTSFGSGNIISGGLGTFIRIGDNCMFGEGVDIWSTDTHSVTAEDELLNPPASITIGNHVWIGKDVAVLKGVTIGENAVVGMRSLVTKDIKASTLNVGSPSKEIKTGINWSRTNPNNVI